MKFCPVCNEFVCQMDNTLIFGKDQVEHDQRLEAALICIEKAGMTLNFQKCEFSMNKITFLGHVIDAKSYCSRPKEDKGNCGDDPMN